jgi:hypothetical protein
MIRTGWTAALAWLVVMSGASAQSPAPPGPGAVPLRWAPKQVLLYKVEHTTLAVDSMGETKTEIRSLLRLTRRWEVLAVDAAGVATLQMSLTALMQERTIPGGEVVRYDSANPDKSDPQLKEFLGKFLNVPLAKLRVDGYGRVVEVQSSKFGPPSNFENELPFVGILPAGVRMGQTWERAYQITLVPPLGTGEKVDSVQRYACKAITGDLAAVSLSSELKATLKAPADAIPLWQMLPEGEVVWDLKNGRLHAATLKIDKELKGYPSEGSSTRFQSVYTIQYAGDR